MAKEPMSFVPIQRVDIYRTTLERIRDLIQGQNMQPGERIPSERYLAEALGVSRTAVREALKVLESYGLIDIRVGSGTYVRLSSADPMNLMAERMLGDLVPDARLIQEALEVRWAIERHVIEALGRVTPEQATELRAVLQHEAEELEGAGLAEGTLNIRFERELARFTGNRLLVRIQAAAHELWVRTLLSAGIMPADKARLHQEHCAILQALEVGDAAGALHALRTHLDRRVMVRESG